MVKYTKPVRTLEVKHLNGDTDTVTDSAYSDLAFAEFDRADTMYLGNGKSVPFHSAEYVKSSVENTAKSKKDPHFCPVDCEALGEPTLTVPGGSLTVTAGEDFDILEGVSAVDGDDNELAVIATVE